MDERPLPLAYSEFLLDASGFSDEGQRRQALQQRAGRLFGGDSIRQVYRFRRGDSRQLGVGMVSDVTDAIAFLEVGRGRGDDDASAFLASDQRKGGFVKTSAKVAMDVMSSWRGVLRIIHWGGELGSGEAYVSM